MWHPPQHKKNPLIPIARAGSPSSHQERAVGACDLHNNSVLTAQHEPICCQVGDSFVSMEALEGRQKGGCCIRTSRSWRGHGSMISNVRGCDCVSLAQWWKNGNETVAGEGLVGGEMPWVRPISSGRLEKAGRW